MTDHEFRSVEDVYAAIHQLCNQLTAEQELQASQELNDIMVTFWTTASEALGEVKLGLLRVQPVVERSLGMDGVHLLQSILDGIRKLFNTTP